MRRFSANYIYPVNSAPLKNGIVEINNNGEITNIIDTKGELTESRNLEFYNGVIIPGFINTHCHLELSELKGVFEKHTGLPKFLKNVIRYKKQSDNKKCIDAIKLNDGLMRQNGIVAVGDIANTDQTIAVKKKSKIYYHTFVETIGLGSNFNEVFEVNKKIFKEFFNSDLSASIVPHAPYSVSKELFLKIKEFSENENLIISIHNQESDAERKMFQNQSGELFKLFSRLGINMDLWRSSGENSIETIIDWLPKSNNCIFVHNTFSTLKDVKLVSKNLKNAYWCLCPLSNLYIENKLPDLEIFKNFNNNVILGTDSLASNTKLSILDEMKAIVKNDNNIEFKNLLKWGTLNGAAALKIENKFGSIEKGKTPGLNLISNFDFEKIQITDKSQIKVLV